MLFSNVEALDILRIYLQYFENAATAWRENALRYPFRRSQSRKVFRCLAKRILETGPAQPLALLRRPQILWMDESSRLERWTINTVLVLTCDAVY